MQNHPGHYNTTTIQPRGSCIFHALNAIEFSFLGDFTLFRALRLQFPTNQTQRMRRRCREYINSLEPCRTEPNLILQSLNSNRIGTSQSPKNVQISVHQEWCANRTKPNLTAVLVSVVVLVSAQITLNCWYCSCNYSSFSLCCRFGFGPNNTKLLVLFL